MSGYIHSLLSPTLEINCFSVNCKLRKRVFSKGKQCEWSESRAFSEFLPATIPFKMASDYPAIDGFSKTILKKGKATQELMMTNKHITLQLSYSGSLSLSQMISRSIVHMCISSSYFRRESIYSLDQISMASIYIVSISLSCCLFIFQQGSLLIGLSAAEQVVEKDFKLTTRKSPLRHSEVLLVPVLQEQFGKANERKQVLRSSSNT